MIIFNSSNTCPLSLHAAAAVAACKFFHFGNGNTVVVPFDGMFQSRCRNSEFNRFLRGFTVQKRVNQTAAKAIAAAYAVNDMQMIGFGEAVVFAVVKHTCPVVIACRNRRTKGNC